MKILTIALAILWIPAMSHAKEDEPTPETAEAVEALDPAIQTMREFIDSSAVKKENPSWRLRLPKFLTVDFTEGKTYTWKLETNKGEIHVKLLPDVAPNHVSNFIYLTELGYFDGLIFHRVIPGFMAQGGCPLGRGNGSPGYKFGGEFKPDVKHDKGGLLSMANAGPGTDGSQFFLTFVQTPWLDGKHTIFGESDAAGIEVLKTIEKVGSRSGKTSEEVKINKATIVVE